MYDRFQRHTVSTRDGCAIQCARFIGDPSIATSHEQETLPETLTDKPLPTVQINLSSIDRAAATLVQRVGSNPIVREEGQTLAEYALILTFATVVVVAALIVLGDRLSAFWNQVNAVFQSVV